jgi:hypothetical protein
MISFEDCVALCGLSEAEIAAIAEHEHIPEIAAAVLGDSILRQAHEPQRICGMIVEDVRAATAVENWQHAAELVAALRHFLATYPYSAGRDMR